MATCAGAVPMSVIGPSFRSGAASRTYAGTPGGATGVWWARRPVRGLHARLLRSGARAVQAGRASAPRAARRAGRIRRDLLQRPFPAVVGAGELRSRVAVARCRRRDDAAGV